MNRRKWPLKTRRDVLLRCCFVCTAPGCENLASDLHHVELLSKGGSNEPSNLIGLCKYCHREVHGSPEKETIARQWLSDQIEAYPVRVSNVARNVLYEEILKATSSLETMLFHNRSVYNSNQWNAYEVFLKATWQYLCQQNKQRSDIGCVVLYHFVNLYRRRSGKRYNSAAIKKLAELQKTLNGIDDSRRIKWLESKILYHKGYLDYLINPTGNKALQLFEDSASLEAKQAQSAGHHINSAQSMVVRMRRGENVRDDLKQKLDALVAFKDVDSVRWWKQNIPIHIASVALAAHDYNYVHELVSPLVPDPKLKGITEIDWPGKALYVYAISLIEGGDFKGGKLALIRSRKTYLAHATAEGRAAVMVSWPGPTKTDTQLR